MDNTIRNIQERLIQLNRNDLANLLDSSSFKIAKAVEGGCFAVLEDEEYEISSHSDKFYQLKKISTPDKTLIRSIIDEMFPDKKDMIKELNFYSYKGES